MEISDINIGETYLDNGNGSFSTPYKFVIITEKTTNSIRFKDSGGFYSWMHIDSFKKRMRLKPAKIDYKSIKLFCEKGTNLIVEKELELDDDIVIPIGEKCEVIGIKGLGFDIETTNGVLIRVINSQMSTYFKII